MRVVPPDCTNMGDPVLIATVGRSGTHLLIDTLRHQFAPFSLRKYPAQAITALFVPLDQVADRTYPARAAWRTFGRARRAVARAHGWPGMIDRLSLVDPQMSAFVRERSSVISGVRSPIVAFPKLWAMAAQHQKWSGDVDGQETFIAERAQQWAAQVDATWHAPRTMFVRLEEMLETPEREIARMGEFLGLKPRMRAPLLIPPFRSRTAVRISRLGIRPLSTHHFVREQMRRDFPLEWTAERLAILDRYAGDAMERLGYPRPAEGPATSLARPAPQFSAVG